MTSESRGRDLWQTRRTLSLAASGMAERECTERRSRCLCNAGEGSQPPHGLAPLPHHKEHVTEPGLLRVRTGRMPNT